MIGTLVHKISKVITRSDDQTHPEDNISSLCPSFLHTLTFRERSALRGRVRTRRKETQKVEATIASVEALLQKLEKQRDTLHRKNKVAWATLDYEYIANGSVEDDISILATNYVPDLQESDNIKFRLFIRRKRIGCIEEAIQLGELDYTTREALQVHVASLKRACVIGDAILAPMRRLPAEIMGDIFVYAVPSLSLYPLVHDQYPARTPLDPAEPHPHNVRIQIGQVCRNWRRITMNTPRLWDTIALNFPLSLEISHLERCLQNSKACQLDVFVETSRWFEPANEDHIIPVLALIHGELNRIRLFISQNDFQNYVASVFPRGMATVTPCLEFCSLEELDIQKDELLYGSVDSPMLNTLILIGANPMLTSLPATSFLTLRRLVIGRSDTALLWRILVNILSSCSCLRKLFLNLRTLESYEPSVKVTLPALEAMTLRICDPSTFAQIVESIYAPTLNLLNLESRINGLPSISNILDSLPDDSAASLRHLTLCSVTFKGEDVAKGLRRLQNIRGISTYSCALDEVFFSTLVPVRSPGDGSWTCFKLTSLEFYDTSLHDRQLLRLLHTRMLPDSIAFLPPGYLDYVMISGHTGLCDQCIERLHQLRKKYGCTLMVSV